MRKLFLSVSWLFISLPLIAKPVGSKKSFVPRPLVMANISELSNNPKLKSLKGQEITVLRIPAVDQKKKTVDAKHRFYIQGGLHGDETETTRFVAWLASRVRQGKSALNRLPSDQVAFDFVPVANPDGVAKTSRYNDREINLNRNFGHLWGISRENPGSQKFSEPETQAIKYLLDKHRYTAAVDVHGYINWLVAPSKPGPNVPAAQARAYEQWMIALSSEMQQFDPTYKLKTAQGLGDGGAFEDYAYWQAGTKAFCLEMATAFQLVYRSIDGEAKKVDLFESYEHLIYRVFKRALDMSEGGVAISQN